MVSSTLRSQVLRSLAMSSVPLTKKQTELVLPCGNIGDWFLLFKLGQNLNPIVFREILDDLADSKITNNEEEFTA